MHFHCRNSKTGECRQQKHTQHAPSTKTECDCLNGWIRKKKVTYAKISPKMVNPRDVAGERRRRRRRRRYHWYDLTRGSVPCLPLSTGTPYPPGHPGDQANKHTGKRTRQQPSKSQWALSGLQRPCREQN